MLFLYRCIFDGLFLGVYIGLIKLDRVMVYKKIYALLAFVLILYSTVYSVSAAAEKLLLGRDSDLMVDKDTAVIDINEPEYPIYRRIHSSDMLRSFDFERDGLPNMLEFHVVNNYNVGLRLYENSGDYRSPNNDRFGVCGGRVYNVYEHTGDYKRDSIGSPGNVISFLGMNNSAEYGATTNYAFLNDGNNATLLSFRFLVD